MFREQYNDNEGLEIGIKPPMNKREETKKNLLAYCEKTGNKLVFIEPGKDNKNMPEEIDFSTQATTIKGAISILESYLNAPMFTDEFHVDRDARDEWEEKLGKQIDKNTLNFYESNRLKRNTATNVTTLMMAMPDFLDDAKLIEKLNTLEKEVSLPEIFSQDGEYPKYDLMSDQEKIVVMRRFTEVVKKIIRVLKEGSFTESEKN